MLIKGEIAAKPVGELLPSVPEQCKTYDPMLE